MPFTLGEYVEQLWYTTELNYIGRRLKQEEGRGLNFTYRGVVRAEPDYDNFERYSLGVKIARGGIIGGLIGVVINYYLGSDSIGTILGLSVVGSFIDVHQWGVRIEFLAHRYLNKLKE